MQGLANPPDQHNGGRLSYESDGGRGTTFSVSLRARDRSARLARREPGGSGAAGVAPELVTWGDRVVLETVQWT